MSLYRQAGAGGLRRTAVAAALGVLVGLATGLLAARGGGDEPPTVREALAALGERLSPAVSGLELVAIEYREAVRDGRVVAPTEYAAARADVRRARQAVAGSRADLEALHPRVAARLDAELSQLDRAVADRAPPAQVEALAGRAQASLRTLVR